ncbi:polysaccharide biosynthesis C-terminal domain-containing protein [Rhizobium sp. BK251]|uniref:oligosaccharide flippase family protein n=1 Tax=Rhizobium sp. BK251 TaxID=2512125 RepID=UPI001404B0CB|nr:polysaccharide biosynthesis C-terminal domain-containing protein [Rhizobium sp. BK251]
MVFANFVCGVIVANLLGVDGAGVVAFVLWIALVVAPVIDGGTALSVSRFPANLRGQADSHAAEVLPGVLARRLLLYNSLALIALASLYLNFSDPALRSMALMLGDLNSGLPLYVVITGLVLALFQSLATFGTAYLRGSQQFTALGVLTFISMIASIVSVSVGIRLYGTLGAIAGYAAGQLCLVCATLPVLWRRGVISPELGREVRRYARFAWAANVCSTFVWSRIEILFLQIFWNFREVGLFNTALALAALASQGPLLLTGAFPPMLSEKQGRNDRAGLQFAFASGTRILAMIAFPSCLGMAAVAPTLIRLLYGAEFEDAAPAAMVVMTAAALTITTVIGTHLVTAFGRSDFIFISSLTGAVLSVTIGLLLVPPLGLIGAAAARALVQLVMIGLGLWFITYQLGFTYPFRSLLGILAAALVAALAAFLAAALVRGPAGLLGAACLNVLVYVAGLRFLGAAHPDDILLARRLSSALPPPLAKTTNALLSIICPVRAPAAAP